MANKIEYKDIIAFHPGYYLKDIIDSMDVTQEEFAKRLGVSGKTISKLVNGSISLSDDIAIRLSTMLGTSFDLWKNLQTTYDKKVAEIKIEQNLEDQCNIASCIDSSFFVNLGIFKKGLRKKDKVKVLCKYLKISDLNNLKDKNLLVNFRSGVSDFNENNIINSKVWLQTAINIGETKEVCNFNTSKLYSYIDEIRGMTVQDPSVFLPRLREIFKDSGVIFVLLPHLKNSGINGAVVWIDKNKVILAINDRRNFSDTFWFSLFHEIKHVLQQKNKRIFINGKNESIDDLDLELEREADLFAQNTLIPKNEYYQFIASNTFTEQSIIAFAKSINIHPGIVVGRLQHDGILHPSYFTRLKAKYKII